MSKSPGIHDVNIRIDKDTLELLILLPGNSNDSSKVLRYREVNTPTPPPPALGRVVVNAGGLVGAPVVIPTSGVDKIILLPTGADQHYELSQMTIDSVLYIGMNSGAEYVLIRATGDGVYRKFWAVGPASGGSMIIARKDATLGLITTDSSQSPA